MHAQELRKATREKPDKRVCLAGQSKGERSAEQFTHTTLKNALGILLVAARVLPKEDLVYTVARRMFNLEHFVDFDRSDPAAKSHLLHAAFSLLKIARQREVPVRFCISLGPQIPSIPLAFNVDLQ